MNATSVPEYSVEIGENSEPSTCYCCGQKSEIGHGFVYKDRDARAVYYAGWAANHSDKKITIALAVGEWSDDSTSADRTCFGLEAYEGDKDILFSVIDAENSPWTDTDLLGKMLSRKDALKHPLLKEVFVIAEHIVRNHNAINKYLNNYVTQSPQS